jgi:hypothetical protein
VEHRLEVRTSRVEYVGPVVADVVFRPLPRHAVVAAAGTKCGLVEPLDRLLVSDADRQVQVPRRRSLDKGEAAALGFEPKAVTAVPQPELKRSRDRLVETLRPGKVVYADPEVVYQPWFLFARARASRLRRCSRASRG